MEDIHSLTFLRLINSSLPSGSLSRPLGTLSHASRSLPCPPQTFAGTLHWAQCDLASATRQRAGCEGPNSLTCYSPDGHGVLFRRGHRDHDVVHVSQVLPMRQVDGLPFPMHPIFGEPGLFEIY